MGIQLVVAFVTCFLILGLTVKEYKGWVRGIMLAAITLLVVLFIFR